MGWFRRNTLPPEQRRFQSRVHTVADALVTALEQRSDTGRPLYASPVSTYTVAEDNQPAPDFVKTSVFAEQVRREFSAITKGQFELGNLHLDSTDAPTRMDASVVPGTEGRLRKRVEKQALQSREASLRKALAGAVHIIQFQLLRPRAKNKFVFGNLRPDVDGGLVLSFSSARPCRIQQEDLGELQDRIERCASRNFGLVITRPWEFTEKFGVLTMGAGYHKDG